MRSPSGRSGRHDRRRHLQPTTPPGSSCARRAGIETRGPRAIAAGRRATTTIARSSRELAGARRRPRLPRRLHAAASARRCSTRFPNAILNIHPSLLPSFPGVDAQRQALEHGVKVSGVTVHLVTAELDAGPIVAAARGAGAATTTREETLAARILDRGASRVSGGGRAGARRRTGGSKAGAVRQPSEASVAGSQREERDFRRAVDSAPARRRSRSRD